MPSGEMVAPLIDSFVRDKPRDVPAQHPEHRPVPRPPGRRRGREHLHRRRRRASAAATGAVCPPGWPSTCAGCRPSQELTVEAAITGDRDEVVDAMLADPLAGRIDCDRLAGDDRRDARRHGAVAPAVRVTDAASPATVDRRGDTSKRSPVTPPTTAADAIRESIASRGAANVMFATGNSQLAFLAELAHDDRHRLDPRHRLPHGRVRRDRRRPTRELPALHARHVVGPSAPGRVPLHRRATRPTPRPSARRYAALLRAHPLDLCCLGIGENGHLAFNDPPVADFDDPLEVKVVSSTTRASASRSGRATSRRSTTCRRTRSPSRSPPLRLGASRPRDRAGEPQGGAGPRRARGTDEHRLPGVDPSTGPRHAVLYLDRDSAALLTLHR